MGCCGLSMFITFEGTEGVGKTTQIRLLAERLEGSGERVVVTRQPGGEQLGAALRHLLLEQSEIEIAPMAELLMMMADRAQSVRAVIAPALESGETVICDRYADSSVAYQGYGRGLDVSVVRALNAIATGGLTPGLTFLLDTNPEMALARQAVRNKMEREPARFHERVREGFLAVAESEPERVIVIDASADISIVAERIWERYEAYHRHRAQ